MRQILFLAVITISLFQVACKKPYSSCQAATSLDGKWRMIAVKDNTSGITTTKPSSIQNDVDITFASTSPVVGSLTGNTPTNIISKTDYTTGANHTITISELMMTKVWETSWGTLFVENIRFSKQYNIDNGGLLNINTTNATLTFRRL